MIKRILSRTTGARHARRLLASGVLALAVLGTAGCDGLLEVDNPGNILEENLNNPQMIEALSYTPEGVVSGAYDGGTLWAAVVADEAFVTGSGTDRIRVDNGYMASYNNQYEGIYNELASAGWVADDVTRRLQAMVEDPSSHIGVANGYFWAGIALLTLADLFEEVVIDGNPPIRPAAAIDSAISRLESAVQVAGAAGNATLEAGAHASLARAYRSLYFETMHPPDPQGAADISLLQQAAEHAMQALAMMPDFRVEVDYAQPGSSNGLWGALSQGRYLRMDPKYANVMDPVSGERDPRIQHSPFQNYSIRTGDPIYFQEKYDGDEADIAVSRAAEAQLIIAEYALMTDDPTEAVQRINNVRTAAGLPDFSSSDAAEIRDQLLYERRVEFWLELRRWQDHRYYEIVPERWVDVNAQAGVHRRWPVSQIEQDTNPYYD